MRSAGLEYVWETSKPAYKAALTLLLAIVVLLAAGITGIARPELRQSGWTSVLTDPGVTTATISVENEGPVWAEVIGVRAEPGVDVTMHDRVRVPPGGTRTVTLTVRAECRTSPQLRRPYELRVRTWTRIPIVLDDHVDPNWMWQRQCAV